jgi:hypothetical protein
MSQESTASFGDHEDYSRPIGGVCFAFPCFSSKLPSDVFSWGSAGT